MTKCETKMKRLNSRTKIVETKINGILETCKLTAYDAAKIKSYYESIKKIQQYCEENSSILDEKNIDKLLSIVDSIDTYADRIIAVDKEKKATCYKQGTVKNRVNKIIKPEEQKESTKSNREGCLTSLLKKQIVPIISAVICTIILTNNISEWKKQTNEGVTDKNYIEWNFNRSKAWLSSLFGSKSIDITNEEDIQNVALDIQEVLAENGIEMSINEIIEAIQLVNFNETNPTFTDKNSILRATVNSGKIISTTGTGSIINKAGKKEYFIPADDFAAMLINVTDGALKPEDFKKAKKVGGYDIYLVLDILVDGLGKENSVAFNYAKLFNEIVTNSVHNFTILETAPNETMYAILGTYNANRPRIKELTHGLNLGPIYGNGVDKNNRVEIDGTYGNICAEEIDKFVRIKSNGKTYSAPETNIFYGPELDKMLDPSKRR